MNILKFNRNKDKYILKLSELTLGIYLIHPLILKILKNIGINTIILNPIIMTTFIVIITFFISSIIIML